MKPGNPLPPQEVELKLALLSANPQALAARLARLPVLARRKSTRHSLHNIYFDTPERLLQSKRLSLRLRRMGTEAAPQWLQTFKTGGRSDSALHQRGEWEVPVPQGALSQGALRGTAWEQVDPDGSNFNALQPVFQTEFERVTWLVRRRNRSLIEVALDIGHIESGGVRIPLCELELELKAGGPQSLFAMALQIADDIPLLPAHLSKAERGYALADGKPHQAQRARAPALRGERSVRGVAGPVLREMFGQFTVNLNALVASDDAEVVHQARVGWRRFRSGLRLFGDSVGGAAPSLQALEPLLAFLGELRDLDVARIDTLPPFAEYYVAGNGVRAKSWSAMMQALNDAATLQRKSVRYALQTPAAGASLLALAQWLEDLALPRAADPVARKQPHELRDWAARRADQLYRKLKKARKSARSASELHRVRILAKRVRYGIEALRDLLPKRTTQGHHQQATELQTRLGASRDLLQACTKIGDLDVNPGLQEFLRGYAAASGNTA